MNIKAIKIIRWGGLVFSVLGLILLFSYSYFSTLEEVPLASLYIALAIFIFGLIMGSIYIIYTFKKNKTQTSDILQNRKEFSRVISENFAIITTNKLPELSKLNISKEESIKLLAKGLASVVLIKNKRNGFRLEVDINRNKSLFVRVIPHEINFDKFVTELWRHIFAIILMEQIKNHKELATINNNIKNTYDDFDYRVNKLYDLINHSYSEEFRNCLDFINFESEQEIWRKIDTTTTKITDNYEKYFKEHNENISKISTEEYISFYYKSFSNIIRSLDLNDSMGILNFKELFKDISFDYNDEKNCNSQNIVSYLSNNSQFNPKKSGLSLRILTASLIEYISKGYSLEAMLNLLFSFNDILNNLERKYKEIQVEEDRQRLLLGDIEYEKQLAKAKYDLSRITNGYDFENFLKILFEKAGYEVIHTKLSGDQGADLIVVKDNRKHAIQAKFFTTPVGNSAVQQVLSSKAIYNADYASVITNNTFTKSAYEAAQANNVQLIDGGKLKAIIDCIAKGNSIDWALE